MLLIVLSVVVMASLNAMVVPLALEKQILSHPRSHDILTAAQACGQAEECWASKNLETFLGTSPMHETWSCAGNSEHLQRCRPSLVMLHAICVQAPSLEYSLEHFCSLSALQNCSRFAQVIRNRQQAQQLRPLRST